MASSFLPHQGRPTRSARLEQEAGSRNYSSNIHAGTTHAKSVRLLINILTQIRRIRTQRQPISVCFRHGYHALMDNSTDRKPLRVAMFTEAYAPIISGVVIGTRTLINNLRAMGHEVDLYAPRHPKAPKEEPGVYRLPAVRVPLPGWIPISAFIAPPAFEKIVARPYDVFHTQHPFTLGTTARHLAARQGAPLIGTVHTQYEQYVHYWSPWKSGAQPVIRWILRESCNRCDHITTVAEGMANMLREYGVVTPIDVIPNDLDIAPVSPAEVAALRSELGLSNTDRLLLSVGRLAPEKSLDFMLSAVAPILKSGSTKLAIVGDGPSRKDLERKADTLGLTDRVTFTGALPHAETARYYSAADLFLMASTTEVHPLTLQESLAAGTPVAAVDSFSARDAIEPGKTGIITANDTRSFGDGIAEVLNDSSRLEALKKTTSEIAKQRTEGAGAKRIEALYYEVLERPRDMNVFWRRPR
jgi:glycosyltransferase involved in cell wall biosynthesis